MLVCVIFSLFAFSTGLRFNSPAAIEGLYVPTYLNRDMVSFGWSFELFNKNWSITSLIGCPGSANEPTSAVAGQIAWFDGDSLRCRMGEIQEQAASFGAAGLWMGSAISEVQANGIFEGIPGGLFTFCSGSSFPSQKGLANPNGDLLPPVGRNQASDITVPEILGNFAFTSLFPSFLPNVTIFLDPPNVPNPLFVLTLPTRMGKVNTFTAVQWLAMICGVAVMCVASGKWSVFFVHEGGFRPSIAQLEMITCFFGGFLVWMLGFGGYSGVSTTFWASVDVMQFFSCWAWGAVATASIILGLYFKEISLITSSSSSAGVLTAMKWPAIILIIILWAALLSGGLVAALDPPGGGPSGTSNFAFAFIVIGIAMGGFLLIFGSISLIFSMRGSNVSSSLWKVVILSLLVVAIMWSLGILTAVWQYFLVETFPYSQYDIAISLTSLMTFPPSVCFLLVMANFRVSLAKEIEVSKSGTSSTSDMSRGGSSSSSSSSSSGSDPVIEL